MHIELNRNEASAVRYAIRDWLPGMAQNLLDEANKTITEDPEWNVEDDFAGRCESLAWAARVEARIGQQIDLGKDDQAPTTELVAATRRVLAEVPATCAVGDGPVIAWSTLDALREAVQAVEPR